MELPSINMEIQSPYRKKLKVGDIFRLKYPNSRYLFGQITSLSAKAAGFKDCIKINVFESEHNCPDCPIKQSSKKLLIAPLFINRLGFSRGYMPVISNTDVIKTSSKYCYFDALFKKHLNDDGVEIPQATGLVGAWGLSNYLVLDDLVSEILGIGVMEDA